MKYALGLIETKGLITCIYAIDTMCKSAMVKLIKCEKKIGSGLVTAIIEGDVGAVKAAVDAGVEAAQKIGEVVSSLVIARPHDDVDFITSDKIIKEAITQSKAKKRSSKSSNISTKKNVKKNNTTKILDSSQDTDKTKTIIQKSQQVIVPSQLDFTLDNDSENKKTEE